MDKYLQFKSKFQFTHPVWGATSALGYQEIEGRVSIHAPRVGCDAYTDPSFKATTKFQFTHPVWGATSSHIFITSLFHDVSIHAPRVGCDPVASHLCGADGVSIHAPRVGCDFDADPDSQAVKEFQFTHPVWGATGIGQLHLTLPSVSIHAPRVGCDSNL